jgi:hypothetical protein
MSSLVELPPELQELIFRQTDLSSLRKLPCLCETIYQLVMNPSFWLAKLRREFSDANMKGITPDNYRDYYLGLLVKQMIEQSNRIRYALPNDDERIISLRREAEVLRLKLHDVHMKLKGLEHCYDEEGSTIRRDADQLQKRIKKVRPTKDRRYLDIRLDSVSYPDFEDVVMDDQIMVIDDLTGYFGPEYGFRHRDLTHQPVSSVSDLHPYGERSGLGTR